MSENQKIITINIEDEMKTAYIDYSMSVIVTERFQMLEMD